MAMFYHMENGTAVCDLCPHHCRLKEGQRGRCRVRHNMNGVLETDTYCLVSGMQVDPIEKKPIARWHPGTWTLSFGSYGCNMTCPFCQNYHLSYEKPEVYQVTPENLVDEALKHNLPTIAYTYNEPTVFYEMMLETAVLAKENGLFNVVVSNGLIEEEPLRKLLPYIDAMNIDFKAFDDATYRKLGGVDTASILRTITIAGQSCHVEATCLIVPGISDDPVKFEDGMKMLKDCSNVQAVHLSRYFPSYHYDEPATSVDLLYQFKETAHRYHKYVYLGNVR